MQILSAETGKRFLLDQDLVETLDSIEALRELVESTTGVAESMQIIMSPDGAQIKSSTFREIINGGGNSEPVLFLFNRQLLDEELPDLSSILEPITPEPLYEAGSSSLLLDRRASITDQCTGYLTLFRSHLAQIEAYMHSTSAHIQAMNRLIQEQQVQAMALDVALSNLDLHTQSVVDSWLEFNSDVHKQIALQSMLLLSFPIDMKILSSIRVHPAIFQSLKAEDGGSSTAEEDAEFVDAGTTGAVVRRKSANITSNCPSATLAEFVPVEKLERWAAGCKDAHDLLVHNVKELAPMIANIQSGTDEERAQGLCVDFTTQENLLRDSLECERKLEAKRVVFERDLSRIQEIIAEITGNPSQTQKFASPPSSLPRDAPSFPAQSPVVSSFPQSQQETHKSPPQSPSRSRDKLIAIEHLAQIHREDYIPEAMALEGFVREAMGKVARDKIQLIRQLLRQLLQVSRLSSSIGAVHPMFTNLESMMENQTRVFAQLQHVHRMPIAYGASMVEIVRRKEYRSILLQKAQDLAEGLSRFRLQEQKRRDNFRVEIRDYVPFTIPGMDDQPPFCELSATNTREILPNVTREHLSEFESEIAALRSLLIDAAPVLIDAAPGGHQSDIPGTSMDGFTNLQAAMKRMLTQVDAMAGDFEKTVVKSLLPDRLLRLEEENSRLRQDLSTMSGQTEGRTFFAGRGVPTASANSPDLGRFGASMRSQLEQAQETIRAYEIRFRGLEKHIQATYNSDRTTTDTIPPRTTATPPPVPGPLSRSTASPSTRSLSALGSPLGRAHKPILKAASSSDIRHTPGGTKEEDGLRRRCKELEFELEKLKLGIDADIKKGVVRNAVTGDDSSRDALQAEIEQLRKRVEDEAEVRGELSKENAKLVEEHSRLQKQFMESRQDAKASLEDLHENLDKTIQQLNEVRVERDEALNRISALEEDLRNQLSLAKEEYDRSQDVLKEASDDNDKMHNAIRTCSTRLLKTVDSLEKDSVDDGNADHERNAEEGCERLRTAVEAVEREIREARRISFQDNARAREQIVELEGSRKDSIEKQEEWEIVCRLACEQLQTYYKTLRNLATTLNLPLTPTQFAGGGNNKMDDSISIDFPAFSEYSDELGGDKRSSSDAIKIAYKQVATLSARLDVEAIARAAVESVEAIEERYQQKIKEERTKIVFYDFRVSDWALFLPTRNPKAWAAFNIGTPHYFLRPTDKFAEQIRNREWIVAQIVHIEEHEVDNKDPSTNPFGLADKVKYYLIESVSWKRKRLSTTVGKTRTPTLSASPSVSSSLATNGMLENSIQEQLPRERNVVKNTARRTFNK